MYSCIPRSILVARGQIVQMVCSCPVISPGPSLAKCGGSTLSAFMVMLESLLQTQCDIADPCGQIRPVSNPLAEYDFIVVGGGTAGSVMASRLSEVAEWKVLLVEAGPNEPTAGQVPSFWQSNLNTSVDWQFVTEPESTAFLNNGGRAVWPRGKMIGGSSSLSRMNYIRGNRKDYDHWEEMGNTGWSYNDVLPYFKKSEDNLQIDLVDEGYHGVGGYMPVTQFHFKYQIEKDLVAGLKEMGETIRDLNGKNQIGFAFTQSTSKNGVKFSASRAFLRPVQNRENLHIMLNTIASKILIDGGKKNINGVELIMNDGSKKRISSTKEVILCCGAINSPKLLLLSGIGDEHVLKDVGIPVVHHLPGVGKNLHDFSQYKTVFTTNLSNINHLNQDVAQNYLQNRDGGMSTNGNSVMGFIQTKYVQNLSDNWPDIRIQFEAHDAKCSKTGAADEIVGDLVDGEIPKRKVFLTSTLIRPKSRGYLTLRNSDPSSQPRLFPAYLSDHADILPIIEGVKFIIRATKADTLRKYDLNPLETPVPGCEGVDFGSDEYWTCAIRRATRPVFHQGGTCKMGPDSDLEAVVDSQLRVRGVQGLRVVDGSIVPQMAAGNSLAPILMIAEKASDMIKHQRLS